MIKLNSLLLLISILFLVIFFFLFLRDKRTVGLGFSAILSTGSFALWFLITVGHNLSQGAPFVVFLYSLTLAFLVIFLGMFPFMVLITFLINGIRIIRREGLAVNNLLTLGSVAFIVVFFLLRFFVFKTLPSHHPLYLFSSYVSFIGFYIIVLMSSYIVSSWLNFINRPQRLDYIVVLGSGLTQNGAVTPLLASRVNKGINIFKKNPGSKLIMSGGKGTDEIVAEAVAMKNYALEQGLNDSDILIENQSRNTAENIAFSRELLPTSCIQSVFTFPLVKIIKKE